MNTDDVFHDANDYIDPHPFYENNRRGNDYDIELPEQEYHSNSGSPTLREGDLLGAENQDDPNQLEFNGGIIKTCQSRVKAPMVKRAIAAVLSNKEVTFLCIFFIYFKEKKMEKAKRDKRNNIL